MMDYFRELNFVSVALRLLLSALIGFSLGLERGRKRRPAGCRTYMLVCMGATLTLLLSQYEYIMVTTKWASIASEIGLRTDVSRFGAQVINGVGFLGAGTILVTGRREVKGLTTAAGLWASACMGLAIGAGFIGMPQMNFYDAELVLEDGQYAVVLDGAKVTLPEEKQAKLKANGAAVGPITLGVRPEHLILSGDEGSMIHGTVDVSEMMGSAVHLHVSACGSDTIMIVPTTELESTSAFTIGSPIAFTFNGVMAHLFDRNTQKNLEV